MGYLWLAAAGLLAIVVLRPDRGPRTLLFVVALAASINADVPLTGEYVTGGGRVGWNIWASDLATLSVIALALAVIAVRGLRFTVPRRLVIISILLLGFLWVGVIVSLSADNRVASMFQVVEDARAILLLAVIALLGQLRRFELGDLVLVAAAVLAFHGLFGFGQFINGDVFGLSRLGEVSAENVDEGTFERFGLAVGFFGVSVTNRVSSLSGASYQLAGVCLLWLPLAAIGLIRGAADRRDRWRAGLGLVCGLVLIALSLSRGAWVATLCAGGLAGLLALRNRGLGSFGQRLRVMIGVVPLVVLLLIPLRGVLEARVLGTNLGLTVARRLVLLQTGLDQEGITLTGMGFNNFALTYQGDPTLGIRSGEPIHNVYGMYLIEGGLVGLGALVGVLIVFAALLLRSATGRRSDLDRQMVASAAMVGLFGLALWGGGTWIWRSHVVYQSFWLVCSLAAVVAAQGSAASTTGAGQRISQDSRTPRTLIS